MSLTAPISVHCPAHEGPTQHTQEGQWVTLQHLCFCLGYTPGGGAPPRPPPPLTQTPSSLRPPPPLPQTPSSPPSDPLLPFLRPPPPPPPLWRGDRFRLTAPGGTGPPALAVALPAIAAVVPQSPAVDRGAQGGGGGEAWTSGSERLTRRAGSLATYSYSSSSARVAATRSVRPTSS